MFENHRAHTRPAWLEIAATVVAAALVLFTLVGIVVSVDHAGDVLRASRAFTVRPKVESTPVELTFVKSPDQTATRGLAAPNPEIGVGQTPEPTIDIDVPVVCPDPSLSDRTGGKADPQTGAGAGPVAPCDRDR